MDLSFSASPESVLGWFEKIQGYFKDFRPETRTMTINYSRKTSTIGLALKIDEGFRKNHNKIKIPVYKGFRISRMQDAVFHEIKNLWFLDNNEWVLDTKTLPPSDGFFIELEGNVEDGSLRDLVHIKPATNRDSTEDYDRYWLDSCIKNPRLLEAVWTELQIDEVDVGVLIDVDKLFGLKVPQEIKDKTETIQNYLKAGKTMDRQLMFNTAREYRKQERESHFNPNEFLQVIQRLTARTTLLDYLSVENRYSIGDIEHPTKYEGIIPRDVKVQTLTTLTLHDPQSIGFLTFKRQAYLDKIKSEFDTVIKKE